MHDTTYKSSIVLDFDDIFLNVCDTSLAVARAVTGEKIENDYRVVTTSNNPISAAVNNLDHCVNYSGIAAGLNKSFNNFSEIFYKYLPLVKPVNFGVLHSLCRLLHGERLNHVLTQVDMPVRIILVTFCSTEIRSIYNNLIAKDIEAACLAVGDEVKLFHISADCIQGNLDLVKLIGTPNKNTFVFSNRETFCLFIRNYGFDNIISKEKLLAFPEEDTIDGSQLKVAPLGNVAYYPERNLWGHCWLPVRWEVTGKVIKGFQRGGSQMGIPTANLECIGTPPTFTLPGVYFGFAKFMQNPPNSSSVDYVSLRKTYKMVMCVGYNPYFQNNNRTLEAHLFEVFDDTFYDAVLNLLVYGMIRVEAGFSCYSHLIKAIQNDCSVALEILNSNFAKFDMYVENDRNKKL